MHSASVQGFSPGDLESAYGLPSLSKGSGQIVAVVDAYDDPNAASDLAFYRSYFGLPSGSFKKFNQEGQQSNYPQGNVGWGTEIALDIEMVAASCPNCTIYLLEANTDGTSDLETAEATAVKLGAHIVSNSWICYGSDSCASESYFDSPGVTYLASSGDGGYNDIGAPMVFPTVVAVGGTSLFQFKSVKRGWVEAAWSGSGSGCATGIPKPPWQHDPDCAYNMRADVAADANANTGASIYDSYGVGGWLVGGGTSESAPFVAGVFGLAGNATSQHGGKTFWEREHEKSGSLYRITTGNNGTCSPRYFCEDGTHEYRDYGGPTGWGSPDGVGAF